VGEERGGEKLAKQRRDNEGQGTGKKIWGGKQVKNVDSQQGWVSNNHSRTGLTKNVWG